jgi:hypothetical protein
LFESSIWKVSFVRCFLNLLLKYCLVQNWPQ